MDVSRMLSTGGEDTAPSRRQQAHSYPTRQTGTHPDRPSVPPYGDAAQRASRATNGARFSSPAKKDQKHVVFQLIDPDDPRIQARLPMRVMISQHDTIDSIITTVKNFYGLYDFGVSFENKEGISIIAAYENFDNDMIVYVRTVSQPPGTIAEHARDSTSPQKPSLGAPFEMRPPQLLDSHRHGSPLRTMAKSAGARSVSPKSETGRRSGSAAPGGKPRPARTKSKDNSALGDQDGYSSGDNGEGSVASSRRSKTEQVNAEISLDNIVEGGRRKRAFESSELPLFVPPQVPISASISSISPQRRNGPPNVASPYGYSNQQTFSYTQPLPSPQSYGSSANHAATGPIGNGFNGTYQQPARSLRGNRPGSLAYGSHRHTGSGVLPTPDPTVGSVISDEDVALQLMRLGDPSAFSHGRTSTSTVDDALSGKAEVASSDEEDEDEASREEMTRVPAVPRFPTEDAGPQRKKQRTVNDLPSDGTSGEEYEDVRDATFAAGGEHGDAHRNGKPKLGKSTAPKHISKPKPFKSTSLPKTPMSPASNPGHSRKGSVASTINFQHQLGVDEEDLSSKPRCQRCRKSKKGCDRQRPCGRCKDAGIGADGCVSEDEGNGRKGRYGRHMGVPVKKTDDPDALDVELHQPHSVPANGYFLAPALPDKSKKRKR
nr:putative transcriptional regulatory protein c56f2.05c [Quercus suber]